MPYEVTCEPPNASIITPRQRVCTTHLAAIAFLPNAADLLSSARNINLHAIQRQVRALQFDWLPTTDILQT